MCFYSIYKKIPAFYRFVQYYSYLITGAVHIDDDNNSFYSSEAKPSPYQIPSNRGDSHKGQMSTGANQEQKFDKSINPNKHESADQSFDISNGDESWDNRISKVLRSQKKHLCEKS